jgi:cyanate permease
VDALPKFDEFAEPALAACAVWLDVGFISATVSAFALLLAFDGIAGWSSSLAWAACSGLLAAVCWWWALSVLRDAERSPPDHPEPQTIVGSQPYLGR